MLTLTKLFDTIEVGFHNTWSNWCSRIDEKEQTQKEESDKNPNHERIFKCAYYL